MNLVWAPRAKRDLNGLVSYIADDSVQAAALVANRILQDAEFLTKIPLAGRIGRVKGTREWVVHKTPYILVYKIISNQIRILRVYHSARRWPSRFE